MKVIPYNLLYTLSQILHALAVIMLYEADRAGKSINHLKSSESLNDS